jgi:hypothetical protein
MCSVSDLNLAWQQNREMVEQQSNRTWQRSSDSQKHKEYALINAISIKHESGNQQAIHRRVLMA